MKAQTPAEGVMKTGDWGDSKMYRVSCECGDNSHDVNISVEADDHNVTVTFYTNQKTDWWTESIPKRYDIESDWLQAFDWFWKDLWNGLITRLRLTKDIWFKGYVKYESVTSMSEQQALNFAEVLKSAVKDCKKFKEEKMTPKVEEMKKGTCGCGRSPTGNCIGWHGLSEEEYQSQLAKYLTEQKESK